MLQMFWLGWKKTKELDGVVEQHNMLEDEVWQLALDVLENENEVVLVAPIAGIDLDDIDISYAKWVLTVKGNREAPEFYRGEYDLKNSECFWWEFVRNIILPENLDFESISASMENNMLVVRINKIRFAAQSIKINRTTI